MFIRATSQVHKKTGNSYTTHRLVESYRNQDRKVRQRTIINLGSEFSIPKVHWKLLADRIEEIQRGQKSFLDIMPEIEKQAQRIAKLVIRKYSQSIDNNPHKQNVKEPAKDYQTVDVNSLEHQSMRKIGAEYVGHHAACQLRIIDILQALGFNRKQINLALGSIITRLVHPGSELNTHRYLREFSALDELLDTDFSTLSLKNLYKVSDQLLHHKESIEKALYTREKDLFQLEEVITLYDITNTYFEGRCLSNPKANLGRSKEKQNGCCLVSLGLVLDSSGFPRKSEILPGNISEPGTLQEMIKSLGADKSTTVVMDAGFATEENLEWLRSNHYKYIVVSRKQHLAMPEDQSVVTVKEDNHNLVQACLIKNSQTDEYELYCHSQAKEAKTQQMVSKATGRFEDELKKLTAGLQKKGCTKQYTKVVEKVGRIKEKYKKVGKNYHVIVTPDNENKLATEITWEKRKSARVQELGVYCLRTNQTDVQAETLWQTYTMLTDLEAAFRHLKSELGLRPVFHQKESRVDGHIFISILAYHLLHTIRYQLKMAGIHESWKTLREILDTHCRITSTLKLQDKRVVSIRKTCSPDTNQATIYDALKIKAHPLKTEKGYL